MARTLGELQPGESGLVSAVGGENIRVKRRLVDMGITPMTQIVVRKIAPMGDPIEVHLRGYDLTLRKEDAFSILLFSQEEAEQALAQEAKAQYARAERASAFLQSHEYKSDQPAHERAARLTDWIIAAQQDGVRLPIPSGENVGDASAPIHTIADCKGHCATCGKCGLWPRRPGKKQAPQEQPQAGDGLPIHLALVGNPNSGKTTLFNAMTGSRESVGNWPGVTVEKKEGKLRAYGHEMTLVDLPGIYSLSPYSMEEVVARNFIIKEKPDAIINIVDGTNLERNLYLTVQLMELERPMILALNMMDEVEKSGDRIDARTLAQELGIPVVPISARTGEGVPELLRQCELIVELVHEQLHHPMCIEPDDVFDDDTHAAHHKIGEIISEQAERAGLPRHWAEIKVLEGDTLVYDALQLDETQKKLLEDILRRYAGEDTRFNSEIRVADSRYRFISQVVSKALQRKQEQGGKGPSERIDRILTNRFLALPIFLLIMLLIFTITFSTVGQWLSGQVGMLVNGALAPLLRGWLTNIGTSGWLVSLICDGVIGGVGGVLEFLPQIALLFLCLSLLEDSGYLSRTAFIMDKPLRRFGLSGKSFIPMLMGFGCTVPATMGARTMENEQHRRMTILLLPFMSCSAKLPVYGLIAGAFFAQYRGLVVFSLYALGILMGIVTGLVFKRTLFHGQEAPFVMEMPPYRWPMLRNTLQHVGERVWHFLEKAGTILLVMSILLWFLQSFDASLRMVENANESMLGLLGGFLAPAFQPLGFGVWQAAVALLAGFVAKEAVVSSLSLFYGFSALTEQTAIRETLSATFTPLAAYSFLTFVLLYVPCMAAVTTMRRELGSNKWTAFMVAYQIAIAYIAALVVYQLGLLLGLG